MTTTLTVAAVVSPTSEMAAIRVLTGGCRQRSGQVEGSPELHGGNTSHTVSDRPFGGAP